MKSKREKEIWSMAVVDVQDSDVSAFTLDIKFLFPYTFRFVPFIFILGIVADAVVTFVVVVDKQTRYDGIQTLSNHEEERFFIFLIYCFVVQMFRSYIV